MKSKQEEIKKVIKFNEEVQIRFPEVSCRVSLKTSDKSIIENDPAFYKTSSNQRVNEDDLNSILKRLSRRRFDFWPMGKIAEREFAKYPSVPYGPKT